MDRKFAAAALLALGSALSVPATFANSQSTTESELDEARLAFELGQYPAAHEKLLAAAYDGDPAAQELVGFMYAFGPQLYPGVKRDLPMAAAWLERAAANGRPAAQHVYCATVRQALSTRRLGHLNCFDPAVDGSEQH